MFCVFGWELPLSLIKNLIYKVGEFELNIHEWSFLDQGVIALTGASGSGKTTILKILCGLLPCPQLFWEFQGKNLAVLTPPERRLGVCFQDLRLFPHLSAKQNIVFAIRARGFSFSDKKKDFDEIISFLELEKSLDLFIEDLSGGEKQRVALARALIVRPHFLFLDEPFSYLDETIRKKARLLTTEIVQRYSIPLLLVSHDKEDIKGLADEEFYLENGKIHKKEKFKG